MKYLYICLLLFFIPDNGNTQTPTTVAKKVMIIRSYNELLKVPNRRPGQGDYTQHYISLYPPRRGALRITVLGSFVEKMNDSKVFGWDLDRDSYLSILKRYNIPLSKTIQPSLLPEQLPEPKTYYRLNEKPITIQMWTAEAVCEKFMKEEDGQVIDSMFIVKSLKNFQPLDNFVDDSFCSIQWTSIIRK